MVRKNKTVAVRLQWSPCTYINIYDHIPIPSSIECTIIIIYNVIFNQQVVLVDTPTTVQSTLL